MHAKMEILEIKVIENILSSANVLQKADGLEMCKYLFHNHHINQETFKSVLNLWRNKSIDKDKKTVRVIKFLTNRITFTMLHKALSRIGENEIAHLLNDRIEEVRHTSEVIHRIKKARVRQRKLMYEVFVTLKSMVDLGQIADPVHALRRLSLTYKARFESEQDPSEKMKKVDLYFIIVLSELDNTTFISSETASYRLFLLRAVINVAPFTTDVVVNSALVLSRRAIANFRSGNFSQAKDDIHSALLMALQSETGPDLCSIMHEQANMVCREYEQMPSVEIFDRCTQTCRAGIQAAMELDGERTKYGDVFKVHYYLKIAMLSLGLDLHGKPIQSIMVTKENILAAKTCLGALERCPEAISMRRGMFITIVWGRLAELGGNYVSARQYVIEAYELACKGKFDEITHFKEYENYLNEFCDNTVKEKGLINKKLNFP